MYTETECRSSDGMADLRPKPASAKRLDAENFRAAFCKLASGVTVVTFNVEGILHGFTSTSLTSTSIDPPLALFCVGNHTTSRPHLTRGRRIGISILAAGQVEIARAFAARTPASGYDEIGVLNIEGVPAIEGALVALVAEIVEVHPAGDHSVCICALEHACIAPDADALVYAARSYRRLGPQAYSKTSSNAQKASR